MMPALHIVPSTSDFGTLAQIREVASQTDQVSRVVCLRDEANCLQEVQTWLGTQVTILAPGSRSTWARALQLFQLVRQSGKRDQSLICWNPGRYDMSSVPLLRIRGNHHIRRNYQKKALSILKNILDCHRRPRY